jgi:hypothetical protein
MGQVLHGSATTTEAVCRAIQNSQESLRALSKRYNINQKTAAKWKKRTSVADRPTGPKEPRSMVLSREEEAVIGAFRQHTLMPRRSAKRSHDPPCGSCRSSRRTRKACRCCTVPLAVGPPADRAGERLAGPSGGVWDRLRGLPGP